MIHAPSTGIIRLQADIGDIVGPDEVIALIGETPVYASLEGVLRGIIRDGYLVREGMKIADIDPRKEEQKNCFTISDKSRALSGSVLEALFVLLHRKQLIEGGVIYGSGKKCDAS